MDISQPVKYVYADSTNRDLTQYPSGNSYVLHLTAPLHSIVRVDLVAAKVPNTMYNITDGSNVLTFNSSNVSIAPGYYSAAGLAQALVTPSGGLFGIDFLYDEGRFLFSSTGSFTLSANSPEMIKCLGFSSGTSFTGSSNPVYVNTSLAGKYLFKSTSIIDLSTNEYVFLDIDEFRTTSVIDSKMLPQPGTTIRSTFGMVPLDVSAGNIKNYKETTDYKQYILFGTPIAKVQRLTIRWIDKNGMPLNFQGFENNAFTLRVHCEQYKEPEEEPERIMSRLEIQRMIEDLLPAEESEKPKKGVPRFVFYVMLLALVGFGVMFFIVRK